MDLTVKLHETIDGDEILATASLDALGEHYEAEGRAPRGGWTKTEAGVVPSGLALARALRALEAAVMETVHEHIDRAATDDV